MKATTGTRRSLRAPLLMAAFFGLAASASGCIIESDPGPCLPNIYIPWSLERAGTGQLVTCGNAGAYTVEGVVNDRVYFDDCLAGQTLGELTIPAGGPGSYTIVVSLLDINNNEVVPSTPPLTVLIPNSCASITTDEAVFLIP